MIDSVPVNTPLLQGNELKYLTECIETGWISSEGPFVKDFEDKFANYLGMRAGVAVCNGSAALDVAIKAIGIQPGDEVIMPAFTIISPAQSVVVAGGIPVLVDSSATTWNMDPEMVEKKITPRTKAILVVHIYGLPADMGRIMEIAKKHNLLVIEDAAEMHGQTFNGQLCGSFGDISTFSFYPNKLITSGEGGMILTNNEQVAERCRKYRNLSFEPDKPRFVHEELGWNYRMTNMQAALGIAQFEQIGEFIERKRWMGAYYQERLHFLTDLGFTLPLAATNYADNIYWVFGLVAPDTAMKEFFLQELAKAKIGTRPFFWPMHLQPVFRKMGLFQDEVYPISEKMGRDGFYLPSGLGLSQEEMDYVIYTLQNIASKVNG